MIVGSQTSEHQKRETLLFVIENRLKTGARPFLRPSEAAQLLDWALTSPNPACQAELLQLFKRLGGLQMVHAAMSDFG